MIADRFREQFAGTLAETDLAEFLARAETSPDGQRLAISLLIDVLVKAVSPEIVKPLVTATAQSDDVVRTFGYLLESAPNREHLICASKHAATDDAPYVRVMELSSFITHYVGVARNITLSPEDVASIRHEFFTDPPDTPLGDVTATWSGYNNIVFVMSTQEFLEILEHASDGDTAADDLNDSLGLGHAIGAGDGGRPELIAISYPSESSRHGCVCRQPTSLDARWISPNFYVSWRSGDNWGRTQSCSGVGQPLRERIHRMLPHLSNDFRASRIGLARVPSMNRERLLQNAYDRVRELVNPSPVS